MGCPPFQPICSPLSLFLQPSGICSAFPSGLFLVDCSAAGWSIPAREAYLLSPTLCLQYESGRRAIHQAITVQCKCPGCCGAEDLCRPVRVLSSWRKGRGGVGVSTVCTADGHPALIPAPLQGEGRVLGLSRELTTSCYEC